MFYIFSKVNVVVFQYIFRQ